QHQVLSQNPNYATTISSGSRNGAAATAGIYRILNNSVDRIGGPICRSSQSSVASSAAAHTSPCKPHGHSLIPQPIPWLPSTQESIRRHVDSTRAVYLKSTSYN